MSAAHDEFSDRRSLPGLLSRLVDQATTLASQEARLARAELGVAMTKAIAGIVSLAVATALLVAGLVTLLQAAVIGLQIYGFSPLA